MILKTRRSGTMMITDYSFLEWPIKARCCPGAIEFWTNVYIDDEGVVFSSIGVDAKRSESLL